MYFEARVEEIDGWQVVTVVGEIDLASLPRYRSAVVSAAGAAARAGLPLAVDLTHCEFLDSLGLGATLGGFRSARAAGNRFAVICPGERVRAIFERCRLDEILDLYSSLPDA